MTGWKQRRITGYPLITPHMMAVLLHLRAALEDDWPFVPLPDVLPRTVRALARRDWIYDSPGLDGIRYKITERGLRALKVYERPPRRCDGICPSCGLSPRHVTASGRKGGYCLDCLRVYGRRKRGRANHPCSRCHKQPRHRYPGGSYSSYCTTCNRVMKRRWKRKYQKRQLRRVLSGQVILCPRCGLKPRHYTDKTIYDWCEDCQRAYMTAFNDRRRPASRAARQRARARHSQ